MSVSITAESVFDSNQFGVDQYHAVPKVANSGSSGTALPIYLRRYLYILTVMLNPFRKVEIERIRLIRKLGWCLIMFQMLDGVLTYQGLYLFGHDAEGNPLIKMMIDSLGAIAGLSFSKIMTISVIMLILVAGHKLSWLTHALKTLLGYYFIFALLPWSFLILQAYTI